MIKKVNKRGLSLLIPVTLKYQKGENSAPQAVVSGQGALAQKILVLPKKQRVSFHKDTKILSGFEIGCYIQAKLYNVIAKFLAIFDGNSKKS